jgi:hypothetical protein
MLTLELYASLLFKGTVYMIRLELPDSAIVDYARVTHNDSLHRQVLEILHYLSLSLLRA